MPLKDVPLFIASVLPTATKNTRPYAVVEYLRNHLVSKKNRQALRLTIDQNVRYGFFIKNTQSPIPMGQENFVRIELKVRPDYLESEEHRMVLKIISKFSPLPVISKRAYAYSLISWFINKTFGTRPLKEINDCENEVKFSVSHPEPAKLFSDLRKYFQDNPSRHFLSETFPYSLENAKVNHYWGCDDGKGNLREGLKLMFVGTHVKPIFKGNTVLVPATNQVVMERSEIKGDYFSYSPTAHKKFLRQIEARLGKLTYMGYLHRSRRAFYSETKDTKRIFHLSLDECQCPDGRVLWQIEVEYVARYGDRIDDTNKEALKQIIQQETAELANVVFSFCNKGGEILAPTNTTKFNWLKNEA